MKTRLRRTVAQRGVKRDYGESDVGLVLNQANGLEGALAKVGLEKV